MSTTSAKQRYIAFTEWHNWAKTKYPELRKKKKTITIPTYSEY